MAARPSTHRAHIALGSNLAGPAEQVSTAMDALDRLPAVRVTARSSLYRSAPWGYTDQPDFINAVVRVETELSARTLLNRMLDLETRAGRIRTMINGPRVLDLDLMLYDDECIDEQDLVVPHPRMHERAFVLVPLLEVDPAASIPGIGPVADLVRAMGNQGLERIEVA